MLDLSNSRGNLVHSTSSVDGAACELSLTSSSSGTAQQARVAGKSSKSGKNRRFQPAYQHPLAASMQASFSEGAHKYHESPQRVCMKHRQTMALQHGTLQTRMVIGAAMVGKCAGFSPYRDAQTKAMESLLQQQNPARFAEALKRHSCLSEVQQAQQLISQKAPQLQACFDRAGQLGNFEDQADSWQQCNTAADDMEVALAQFQAQQEAAEREAAVAQQQAAAAATRKAALAQLQAQQEAVAAAKQEADAACQQDQLRAAVAAAAAAQYILAELLLDFEAAQNNAAAALLSGDAVSNSIQADSAKTAVHCVDSSNTASDSEACPDKQGFSALGGPVGIMSMQAKTAITQVNIADSTETASATASDEATYFNEDLPPSPVDSGMAESSFSCSKESMASEPLPTFTQQEVLLICKVTQERCNTAYGMHAERPTATELDLGAEHSVYSWHKMGAPDNLCLGSCSGVEFELGCQIDRAFLQGSNAFPTEFKNRVSRFMSQHDNCPASLPMHELVQVQCQLQLTGAPHGLLIERLDHGCGQVEGRVHVVLRDDWWWEQHLMPALHAFLRVFANLATQDQHLEGYLMARQQGCHQDYLRQLIWEQWQQPLCWM